MIEIKCNQCKSKVLQNPKSATLTWCDCKSVGVDNDGRVLGNDYEILWEKN